jgi:hypothetical protein
MRDEAPEISPDDAVPRGALFAVEFALDVLRYVFFYREAVHCFLRYVAIRQKTCGKIERRW